MREHEMNANALIFENAKPYWMVVTRHYINPIFYGSVGQLEK